MSFTLVYGFVTEQTDYLSNFGTDSETVTPVRQPATKWLKTGGKFLAANGQIARLTRP